MVAKLNFQQPFLQSLNIILIYWFGAQETFPSIINVEKSFFLIIILLFLKIWLIENVKVLMLIFFIMFM